MFNFELDYHSAGMTDNQLEKLAKNKKWENGKSPWAFWESERTSFGKTFRWLAKYPSFLPLFFSSDHYVYPSLMCRSNETSPEVDLYVSWNKAKVNILKNKYNKKAIHLTHPWLSWRKRKYPNGRTSESGTILFWPHSHPTLDVHVDFDLLIKKIENLPSTYKPLTIMMSSHDIEAKSHYEIRRLGYPIVTAGALTSQKFIDRFYKIISNFRYAVGLDASTQAFYCLEFGIPYLLIADDSVALESLGSPDRKKGFYDWLSLDFPDENEKTRYLNWYNSLKNYVSHPTESQIEFVQEQLGVNSETSRIKFATIVWWQLFLNLHKIPRLWMESIALKFTRFK